MRKLFFALSMLCAGNAWAAEIACDGIDNDSSGYTFGACPAGWMDAVFTGVGCDRECPDLDGGGEDDDGDGYATNAAGHYSTGSGQVVGDWVGVNTFPIAPLHTLTRQKRISFYDAASGTTVTRNIVDIRGSKAAAATVTTVGTAITLTAANDRYLTPGTFMQHGSEYRLITVSSTNSGTLASGFSSDLTSEAVTLHPIITIDGAAVNVTDGLAIAVAPSLDCNDKNRHEYPGIYRACGTDGTQLCQPDGTWTACAEGELTPGTRTRFISPTGSNSNDGLTRATAWGPDFKCIGSYDSGADTPPTCGAGRLQITAGDYVWIMNGTYDQGYYAGAGADNGRVLTLRGRHGTATNRWHIGAYPGQEAVVVKDAGIAVSSNMGIRVYQSSFGTIDNIEIDGEGTASGSCIALNDAQYAMTISRVRCHDRIGDGDDNIAGLNVSGYPQGTVLYNNWVYDNKATTGNAAGDSEIRVFRGYYSINHNNITSSTSDLTDTSESNHGISIKHSSYEDIVHLVGNVFVNCGHGGFCVGGSHATVYGQNNRLINSRHLNNSNVGGISSVRRAYWHNNSLKNQYAEGYLGDVHKEYNPDNSSSGSVCAGTGSILISLRNNLVEAGSGSDAWRIGPSKADPIYAETVAGLTSEDNTFGSATQTQCLFCTNSGGVCPVASCSGSGACGATHDPSAWQALGFDLNSRFGAISWNDFEQSETEADCENGWRPNCDSFIPQTLINGSGRASISLRLKGGH